MKTKTFTMGALLVASLCPALQGADWTQFRGPNHDGSSSEKILSSWPANGLTQVWKAPLKDGFSALTVGGGKAFTLVTREIDGADQESCLALDANTGKELWVVPLCIAKYDDGGDNGAAGNDGGDGPRSTPAYDDGRVYNYSSKLVLKCMNATDGRQVWSHDLIKEHGGDEIRWGNASSPLIEGDLVIVACGGSGQSLIAFDKKTGGAVWRGQNDGLTHSTPVAATILGERQIIFYTQSGLVSVAAKTGSVLWRFPFKFATAAAISPVVFGDMVYCSAGYNVGSGAYKITKSTGAAAKTPYAASEMWFTSGGSLGNHWSTPVCADGNVYGIYGQTQFGKAPLKCVDMATGRVRWSHDGFGPGGCTLVDGHVLVLSDAGDLVLVKATPESYHEDARFHALNGKCWNYAAVSNGRIYARSTKEGVCVDVSPKTATSR